MNRPSELKAIPVAEYMKVRQYVVSMAERCGREPSMLPTMNELALQFGVTRMTVHKALKELIRDGFLISQKGKGTFINPARSSLMSKYSPKFNIGMIVDQGKHCFYETYFWNIIAAFGLEATARHWNVRVLNLSERLPEAVAKEIRNNWIDGVLWIAPAGSALETMQLLKAENFPMLVVQAKFAGFNCIDMDNERNAYETTKSLLAEGRRDIVFVGFFENKSNYEHLQGIRRAFAEAGETFNERLIVKDWQRIKEDLDELLDFGIKPQAIYITNSTCAQDVFSSIKAHGLDIERACRVVAEPFFLGELEGFSGFVREYRFADEAKNGLDILERMLTKRDFSVETKFLQYNMRTVSKGGPMP